MFQIRHFLFPDFSLNLFLGLLINRNLTGLFAISHFSGGASGRAFGAFFVVLAGFSQLSGQHLEENSR